MESGSFLETIRTSGHRLTRQRRLVLAILEKSQDHLDAESLYELAKAQDAGISLATVYRTLALFKEAGLVQVLPLGEDHGHFETVHEKPHSHFTCLQCGRVFEFDAMQIAELRSELLRNQGLRVVQVNLHLSGYCAGCSSLIKPDKVE